MVGTVRCLRVDQVTASKGFEVAARERSLVVCAEHLPQAFLCLLAIDVMCGLVVRLVKKETKPCLRVHHQSFSLSHQQASETLPWEELVCD